jgi:molecular chaperone DnaJ
MQKDYYQILGVPKTANAEAIKRAYHQLAKQHHPDVAQGDKAAAEARFKECAEAYEVLSDPRKRAQYDKGPSAFVPPDLADIFGFGFRQRHAVRRGENIQHDVVITLADIMSESEKSVQVNRLDPCKGCSGNGTNDGSKPGPCDNCQGRGVVVQSFQRGPVHYQEQRACGRCSGLGVAVPNSCKLCSGSGLVEGTQEIRITIPAGAPDGLTLRAPEQGSAGRLGAPRGDLLLRIRVAAHVEFQRRDDGDLWTERTISFAQAVLGGEYHIQGVDGVSLDVQLPECCPNGWTTSLLGQGLPVFQQPAVRGRMWVRFVIRTPQSVNEEQKELIRRFDAIEKGQHVQENN